MTLHCYCCGESYERGHFRCCAAPRNIASHRWLGQYCAVCAHCPKHCACAAITPRSPDVRPLAELAHQAAASLLPPAERLRHLSLARDPHAPIAEWRPYRESE